MHSFKTQEVKAMEETVEEANQTIFYLSLSSSSNYDPTTPFVVKLPQQSHYKLMI